MESLIPKIILNNVGILIPSNSKMTNFLGIPNFLIKIGVNNLQNIMNIKKKWFDEIFQFPQSLKHVHKKKKKNSFKGVFFPLGAAKNK